MENVFMSHENIKRLREIGEDPLAIIEEIVEIVEEQMRNEEEVQEVITYCNKLGQCTIEIDLDMNYDYSQTVLTLQ